MSTSQENRKPRRPGSLQLVPTWHGFLWNVGTSRNQPGLRSAALRLAALSPSELLRSCCRWNVAISRTLTRVLSLVGCALLVLPCALQAEESEATARQVEFFEAKIRPVLIEHCYECHAGGQDELQGGLALDYRDGLLAGGDSGPAVVPQDPDGSLLLDALRYEGLEMPPSGKLPAEVIENFEEWIRRGAHDPRVLDSERAAEASSAPRQVDLEKGREFWSFQAPRRVDVPPVAGHDWSENWIDSFILDQLEQAGLQPSADVDRARLLRRLTFDLTGLPPTTEQQDGFLSDTSPAALEHVVDQLLGSPRFGEHWARHWFDLARYADSNGSDFNATFHHAWRYRNYVIAGMNRDKPFDQFIREQLAGDLLPYDSDDQRAEQLIGTGFLMIGAKMLSERDKVKLRMDVVDEQVDTVGRVFLGMTLGCARCHDHKFDPIPTADYYALAGIMRSTKTLEGEIQQYVSNWVRQPLPIDPEHARQLAEFEEAQGRLDRHRKELEGELKRAEQSLEELVARKAATSQDATGEPQVAGPKDAADVPRDEESDSIPAQAGSPADVASSESFAVGLEARAEQLRRQLAEIENESKQLQSQAPPPAPLALAVQEAEDIEDCRICIRGEPHQLGPTIPRGFLQVISFPGREDQASLPTWASGRRELADWITDPENPLTARVLVNRIWQKLMGEGLVRTVDNFGVLGRPPTHPELLDRLALEFIEQGWSVKHLVRQIVLSRAYRMDSRHRAEAFELDPENRLWWRAERRRLTAEAIRDSLLAAGDQLDFTAGEAPVAHLGTLVSQNRPDAEATLPEESLQRTVYQPIIRGELSPLLTVFDLADPDLVVGQRPVTTTPAQSLLLLNSPLVHRQVRRIAERLECELGQQRASEDGVNEKLICLYRRLFGRIPTREERESAREVLSELSRSSGGREASRELAGAGDLSESKQPTMDPTPEAWHELIHAMLASTEFRMLD